MNFWPIKVISPFVFLRNWFHIIQEVEGRYIPYFWSSICLHLACFHVFSWYGKWQMCIPKSTNIYYWLSFPFDQVWCLCATISLYNVSQNAHGNHSLNQKTTHLIRWRTASLIVTNIKDPLFAGYHTLGAFASPLATACVVKDLWRQ
jgi:hypothetical protein